MMQVIEQTDEEKMAMYMKLSKKELASMLIQANKFISMRGPVIINYPLVQQPILPASPFNPINPYPTYSTSNSGRLPVK